MSIKNSRGVVEIPLESLYELGLLELANAGIADGDASRISFDIPTIDYDTGVVSIKYVDVSDGGDVDISEIDSGCKAVGSSVGDVDIDSGCKAVGSTSGHRVDAGEVGCGNNCAGCTCRGFKGSPGVNEDGEWALD
jgi:hypothetical protein